MCKSDSFTVISKKLELELPLPPQKKHQKKLGPQGLYLFVFVYGMEFLVFWSVLFTPLITSGCKQIPSIGMTSGILPFH